MEKTKDFVESLVIPGFTFGGSSVFRIKIFETEDGRHPIVVIKDLKRSRYSILDVLPVMATYIKRHHLNGRSPEWIIRPLRSYQNLKYCKVIISSGKYLAKPFAETEEIALEKIARSRIQQEISI